MSIKLKRFGLIIISIVTFFGVWSYYYADGYTFCLPPSYSWSVINPKLKGDERRSTIIHEQTHQQQIKEMGCLKVMKMRLTKEGRMHLENEAFVREMTFKHP